MTTLQINTQIPELIHQLEVCLRAGYNLRQSLEIATKDLPEPFADEVQQVITNLEGGIALPAALDQWLERTPSADLDLLIATVKVQLEVGGNLADKFRLLGQIMEKRRGLLSD